MSEDARGFPPMRPPPEDEPRPERPLLSRLIKAGQTYRLGTGVELDPPAEDPDPPPIEEQVGSEDHEGGPAGLLITGPLGEILAELTPRPGWTAREALAKVAQTLDEHGLRGLLALVRPPEPDPDETDRGWPDGG